MDQRKVETEIVAIKEGSAAIITVSTEAVRLAKEASEALAGVIKKSEEISEAIQELRTAQKKAVPKQNYPARVHRKKYLTSKFVLTGSKRN